MDVVPDAEFISVFSFYVFNALDKAGSFAERLSLNENLSISFFCLFCLIKLLSSILLLEIFSFYIIVFN
jgi:hypothetical protein